MHAEFVWNALPSLFGKQGTASTPVATAVKSWSFFGPVEITLTDCHGDKIAQIKQDWCFFCGWARYTILDKDGKVAGVSGKVHWVFSRTINLFTAKDEKRHLATLHRPWPGFFGGHDWLIEIIATAENPAEELVCDPRLLVMIVSFSTYHDRENQNNAFVQKDVKIRHINHDIGSTVKKPRMELTPSSTKELVQAEFSFRGRYPGVVRRADPDAWEESGLRIGLEPAHHESLQKLATLEVEEKLGGKQSRWVAPGGGREKGHGNDTDVLTMVLGTTAVLAIIYYHWKYGCWIAADKAGHI